MKTAQQWFDEYGASHQNHTNKLIHWICVPVIFWTVAALLFALPFPFFSHPLFGNWAAMIMIPVTLYYARMALSLGIGMALFSLFCLWLCAELSNAAWPLWQIAVAVFVLAWIGQFIGHHIEGKRPSFFKDLQFLLIGPAWLLGFVFRKLGIHY